MVLEEIPVNINVIGRSIVRERRSHKSSPHSASYLSALLIGFDDDRLWIPVAMLVIALQLVLAITHQPWHDEYQALAISLQSPDIPALLANLHYEGHPPLWYLLLRSTAEIVPAVWTLAMVQLVVGAGLQALILFRAPAPRIERLFAATSFFILIDYGAISRSLGLGILLCTASIMMRGRQTRWLAIALMPMADVLFGVLSLVSIALEIRNRSIWWPGLALWALSVGLAALSITMPADIVPAIHRDSIPIETAAWLNSLSTLLVPFPLHGLRPRWGENVLPDGASAIVGLAFLVFADRQLVARPFERLLLHGVILATAGLSILVYPLAPRLLSVISWLLVLLRWTAGKGDAEYRRIFVSWLGIGSACGLIAAGISLATPFDISARAASFIEHNGLRNEHWIAYPFWVGSGVSAQTGTEFDRLQGSCSQSFTRWNHNEFIADEPALDAALRRSAGRYGRSYVMTDFALQPYGSPGEMKPLAQFTGGYDGRDLFLYEIGAELPRTALRPPRCAPINRLPLALDGIPPTPAVSVVHKD